METKWNLWIAIYAAGISTLVLVWRLIEFYLEKTGRIKITLKYITQIPVYFTNELGEPTLMMSVVVTNFSHHKRSIDRPSLQTDIKIDGRDRFSYIEIPDQTLYPMPLDPGERREINYNVFKMNDKFKTSGVKKVRFHISDTLGKSYCSNWINF